MEKKEYPFITISRAQGDDVLYVSFRENLNINLTIIKEMIENRLDFTKGQKHFLIMDLVNIKHISVEAKTHAYSSEEGSRDILGGAFIVSTPVSKLIANVLIKTSINIPSKIFSNRESALKWISGLKQNGK